MTAGFNPTTQAHRMALWSVLADQGDWGKQQHMRALARVLAGEVWT